MYFNESVYMNSVHKSCSSKCNRHSALYIYIHLYVNVCVCMYIHLCMSKKKGTRAAPQSDMGPRLSRFSNDSRFHIITTITLIHFFMGWLQSVGSMKSQVSFAEYRLFYRALLQKRLIISSILLTEATPYEIETSLSGTCTLFRMYASDLSICTCTHAGGQDTGIAIPHVSIPHMHAVAVANHRTRRTYLSHLLSVFRSRTGSRSDTTHSPFPLISVSGTLFLSFSLFCSLSLLLSYIYTCMYIYIYIYIYIDR